SPGASRPGRRAGPRTGPSSSWGSLRSLRSWVLPCVWPGYRPGDPEEHRSGEHYSVPSYIVHITVNGVHNQVGAGEISSSLSGVPALAGADPDRGGGTPGGRGRASTRWWPSP